MRAGFGEMPQLFAVPTLGLPALNDHRHGLVLVLKYVVYSCETPSIQTHGEDVIPMCCAVDRFAFSYVFDIPMNC